MNCDKVSSAKMTQFWQWKIGRPKHKQATKICVLAENSARISIIAGKVDT